MKKSFLAISLYLLLFASCGKGLFLDFAINNVVPTVTKPRVDHFATENAIVVEWDEDIGADEYILYRDVNIYGDFSNEVYRGTALSYVDRDVVNGTFYYYRLAKRREKKEFNKSDYVYGVANTIRRDDYEKNNDRSSAKKLDDISSVNIYYYQDEYGNVIEDRDWFYVTLEARKVMIITIDEFENLNNQDIYINIEESDPDAVSSAVEFELHNGDYYPRTIYFQITVNKAQILGPPDTKNGIIGCFRINIVQIINEVLQG